MISRVRRDLRRALPVNFEIVQADRREHFRLNPRLMVLPVDLAALADHPDGGVRRVIAGWNGPSRSGRP